MNIDILAIEKILFKKGEFIMKSKKIALITLIILVFSLVACTDKEKNVEKDSMSAAGEKLEITEKDEEDILDEETNNSNEAQKSESEIQEDTNKNEGALILVYISNDDSTAFSQVEMQIETLSPEKVISALVEQGVLVSDVQMISFSTENIDGIASIELDLNSAFSSYVSSMGSTGEYYTIGSICNTFLDAYACEQIKITVDGKTLSTGHAEYPGYMTRFE